MKTGKQYEGRNISKGSLGYEFIWVNGKRIPLHVYMWESVYGKKPKGHEIHHKDFIKDHNWMDNFELLTNSDHQKVHKGWERIDGIWTRKPCNVCNSLLTFDKFYLEVTGRLSSCCKECRKQGEKNRYSDNPEFQKEKKRQWRKDNPEKSREYDKRKHDKQMRDNPDKVREHGRISALKSYYKKRDDPEYMRLLAEKQAKRYALKKDEINANMREKRRLAKLNKKPSDQ